MSGLGEPYIPADESPLELTLRVVLVGIVLGVLMTAANAYLGLYAGMTVSASIPAAVMSMMRGSCKRIESRDPRRARSQLRCGVNRRDRDINTPPLH